MACATGRYGVVSSVRSIVVRAAMGLAGVVLCWGSTFALAGDWPTFRHDIARSGITDEKLGTELIPCWTFRARHAPQPAWGDPKPVPVEDILELRRVHFDDVFQPVAAGGKCYFGSSADNRVTCLDLATGKIVWTVPLGGPVRLAPTVADERVYVGCDDGYAYCLDAEDGSLRWKFHAAPEDRRVLGHGKMISLWPLRTGVLVDGNTAYFSAGIFPAEGVFLYAVDAASGRELWRNDGCGEEPQSRISPQGYLLASPTNLYVPMGRVSPAVFDRSSGRLTQSSPFFGKTVGGAYALLAGEDIYTGTEEMAGYRAASRDRFAVFPGRKMVVTDQTAYLADDVHLTARDRQVGNAPSTEKWTVNCPCHDALILAGGVLVAGGEDEVVAVDATSGTELWHTAVDGAAKGLAVADGRLLVSTDKGIVYCFGPAGSRQRGVIEEPADAAPFADSPHTAMMQEAAEMILNETGITRGFCLVYGLETGQLALELARRTELQIYAVSPDAAKVTAARKRLDAAGLYGVRVCVEHWPLDDLPYANYFADLIVSETALLTGRVPGTPAEMLRVLKPLGGTIMFGQPKQSLDGTGTLSRDELDALLTEGRLEDNRILDKNGVWAHATRGPLPGAGDWTHEYGNPGNTACGNDTRVHCPLGVLWFGHPGPGSMVNRHQRAAGPLSFDGRMFVQGENVVMAYDIYNGLRLWRREIPGAMRVAASHDCSNLAVSRDGLFVALDDRCLRLDPATGQTKATYPLPPAPDGRLYRWGWVATVGKRLYGSSTLNRRNSNYVFMLDVDSGELLWHHAAKGIPNNTIAIDDDRVFLVCDEITDDQRKAWQRQRRAEIDGLDQAEREKATAAMLDADLRAVVALDAATGRVQWRKVLDITNCGGRHAGVPNDYAMQAAMVHDGVLVLFGVYLDGHYWQQFFAGQFDDRRVIALSTEDGESLWSRPIGFRVRPMIVGDTFHAEPWAYDLHTGQQRTREHPVTGETSAWQFARPGHHCGCPSATERCLFFRSYNLGYYDLETDDGTMHFGAQRPGCWINMIPAGGLLLVPEASAGCMCPFPNMCSVVLEPTHRQKAWAWYSAVGPMTPVKRLGLNFGARGDRKDADGNLWLGCPRPYHGRLVLPLEVDVQQYPGGKFVTRNSTYTEVEGTDAPWLFASAARGLRKCVVPLLSPGDGTALFRVRLLMVDFDHDRPGQRVFDIKLQGQTVQRDFDAFAAAGGRGKVAVAEFDGIRVSDKLSVELVSNHAEGKPEQQPVLHAMEIVRQRVVAIGSAVPQFELSNASPQRSDVINLANLREQPVRGSLVIESPAGFQISPSRRAIELAPGQRTTVPIEAVVEQGIPAGQYQAKVKIGREDGEIEVERTIEIDHLGRRSRVVFQAAEDAFVHNRYPDRARGGVGTLLVDGGNEQVGDTDHALAYFKFPVDLPGTVVSIKLRLRNAGNPTGNSGLVRLVTGTWDEKAVTYNTRPALGDELGQLGPVSENAIIECPLKVDLRGQSELSLAIDPTSCDGVDYLSREAGGGPELVVEYEP